jgi:hypothetical protein
MYAGSEVSSEMEPWLRLYFWDGSTWQILPTELDPDHNTASCPVQGPGLYALMASVEVPLYGPGWNLVSYPIQETRPVTQALLSISGYYTTVYGFDAASETWHMYDVTADPAGPYANDLDVLEYAHGYWINASDTITLYLQGDSTIGPLERATLQSPPSSFYGPVLGGVDFTPAAGMPVTATVDGAVCAQGETILYEGDAVYVLHVLGGAGCGTFGDEIVFEVDGQTMAPRPTWDNSRVRRLPLEPDDGYEIYLPLVIRN